MGTRRIFSGTCLCGHKVERHHCFVIVDPEKAAEAMSPVSPGACCAYGNNENEGLGPDGEEVHCDRYVDTQEPDEAIVTSWSGTTNLRSKVEDELISARLAMSPLGVAEGALPGLITHLVEERRDILHTLRVVERLAECKQDPDEEEFWCMKDGSAHSCYCIKGVIQDLMKRIID